MELHVRAVSARFLLDKQTFGRQDPYCILRLRGKTSKTRVHDNGDRSPVWNEKFVFEVYDLQQDQLHVEVKDKNFASSVLIGELRLPVSQFFHGNVADMWFKLTNGGRDAGEINLRVQLLGAQSGNTMQASAYPVAAAAPGYPQAQQAQSQQQPVYAQPQQQQQPVYAQAPQQQQQPVYAQQPPPQPVYAQPPPQPVYAQPPQQVRYAQPPVMMAPPPVVMAPPPVVMAPPPVVMAPPPVVMAPQTVVMGAPVVYGHDYYHHRHGYHHDYDGGLSTGAGLALGVGAGVLGGLILGEALDDGGCYYD